MECITDLLHGMPEKNNILLVIKEIIDHDNENKLVIYLLDINRFHPDPYFDCMNKVIGNGPLFLYEHVDMPQTYGIEMIISNNIYVNINYLIECGIDVIKIDENFITFSVSLD